VTEGATEVPSYFRSPADQVFLDLLAATTGEGRPVSEVPNAGNYAPRLFAKRPERQGYRQADFMRAMEMLFSRREITTVDYGRKSDMRRKIIRATKGGAQARCGGCAVVQSENGPPHP
jgi:hypothetical protein